MAPPRLRFGYAGIRVRDLRRSLAFYRGMGFRIHRRGKMEHGGEWVHLRYGRQMQKLELNFYPPGSRFHEPYRAGTELDHLGFFTSDVDYWVQRARRLGATVAVDFSETRERLAYVRDPNGIWIEFCGPPRAAKRPAK
ncbi:MAG TPA: VOC family protein [Thermoplasmata archaeon]|nr:VOC family protein [Thermoplasmata archaeon]